MRRLEKLDSEHTGVTLDVFRQQLHGWRERHHFTAVDFHEDLAPENDPYPDYFVVYRAEFVPESLRQMRFETWLTDDGYISVGVEKTGRIAQRLGVRRNREYFAGGFEPIRLELSRLLWLLEQVSTGRLKVRARVVPLIGLVGVSVFGESAEAELRRYFRKENSRLFAVDLNYDPWT